MYVDGDGNATQFQSIFAAMWWCLPTLLTMGYGDIVPVTAIGKLLACITSFVGVIVSCASVTGGGTDPTKGAMRPQRLEVCRDSHTNDPVLCACVLSVTGRAHLHHRRRV